MTKQILTCLKQAKRQKKFAYINVVSSGLKRYNFFFRLEYKNDKSTFT